MFPSRIWREMPQRYRLEAQESTKTGKKFYPPRLVEPGNNNRKFKECILPEEGKLLTYTVIRTPASQFKDEAPYALGIIEFDNGARMMAQIVDVDVDKIKTGMDMRLEFRRIQTDQEHGVLAYGYKMVPKWY